MRRRLRAVIDPGMIDPGMIDPGMAAKDLPSSALRNAGLGPKSVRQPRNRAQST
jgi:hypothetical protein